MEKDNAVKNAAAKLRASQEQDEQKDAYSQMIGSMALFSLLRALNSDDFDESEGLDGIGDGALQQSNELKEG